MKETNNGNKQRSAMWLYPETYQKMDRNIEVADCKNRSDFLEKAIDFYVGYLTCQHATTYLSKILLEAIAGTLKENENRQSANLFRLSVEMSVRVRVTALVIRD